MCDQFHVDVCLLYVVDRETGALELKMVQEHDQAWRDIAGALSETRAREMLRDSQVTLWKPRTSCPRGGLEAPGRSAWQPSRFLWMKSHWAPY